MNQNWGISTSTIGGYGGSTYGTTAIGPASRLYPDGETIQDESGSNLTTEGGDTLEPDN